MAEPRARFFDGVKFMWDGKDYGSADEAEKVKVDYEKNRFETRIVEEDGKFQIYTRRVVTDVQVEGSPPA